MHINNLFDPKRFHHTMFWSVLLCALVVSIAATLARATLTLSAALTNKPDIAIYLLLEDEEVGKTELLRETYDTRDYLAETKEGPKFVRLKKGFRQWYIELEENLHEESETGTPAMQNLK